MVRFFKSYLEKLLETDDTATATNQVLGKANGGGDYDKDIAAYFSGDYATALREWRPLAEQGDAIAQYMVGGITQTEKVFHRTIRLQ